VNNFDGNSDDQDEEMKATVSIGGGNWTSHIWFDDKVFWKATDPIDEWTYEGCPLLPSDS
jgi:hypothetical protein